MFKRIFLTAVLTLFTAAAVLPADIVEAAASVDKKQLKLGDVVRYTITVKRAGNVNNSPGVVPPAFEGFRVQGSYTSNNISIINNSAEMITSLIYDLIAVKSGEVTIQPAEVRFINSETKKQESIFTKPVVVTVDTGKKKPSSTPEPETTPVVSQIKEIKMKYELGPGDIAPWLIAALVLLLGTGAAAYFIFKKPAPPAAGPAPTLEDYRKEALRRLRKAGDLLKTGNSKAYHSEAYEAVRYFLVMRFGKSLYELTTSEIMTALKNEKLDATDAGKISDFLRKCDLVKFADYKPADEEIEAAGKEAADIIESV